MQRQTEHTETKKSSLVLRLVGLGFAALVFAGCASEASSVAAQDDTGVAETGDAATGQDDDATSSDGEESNTTGADNAAESDASDDDSANVVEELVAEQPVESFGSGIVTLDGVEYPFETTLCADDDGLLNGGVGVTADGVPYVVKLSVDELLDEQVLDIELSIDREGIFTAPSFEEPTYSGNTFKEGELSVDGMHIVGWVTGTDLNSNTEVEGETFRLEVDATCEPANATIPSDADASAVEGTNYCEYAQRETDLRTEVEFTPLLEPEAFEDYLSLQFELLDAMDRPAEVADDLGLIESALRDLDSQAADVDYVFMNSLVAVETTIGDQEVINAGLRIAGFNEAACGIEGATQ